MSNLHAKIKLVGQTYLFGEKISLRKNEETVVDLSKLNVADLEILGHQIKNSVITSNVSADEFFARSNELRGDVAEGNIESVAELQTVEEVRVLDAEVETEDGKVVTVAEAIAGEVEDPRLEYVRNEIIDAPGAKALVAIKNIPDVTKEVLEFAINTENASKGRKSIVKALEDELAALSAE